MRAYLAAAACVFSVALLAGCSNSSQGSSALPGPAGVGQMADHHGTVDPNLVKGRITPDELFKLQAEGKLPGPVPLRVLKLQYAGMRGHTRPRFHGDQHGTVKIWASDTSDSYLVGENMHATKTLKGVDTESNGCYYPVTVQVDGSQNIWNSCEYNASFDGSAVQEYSSSGSLTSTYNGGCPAPVSECEFFYAYSFAAAANSSDVFSALTYFEYETTNSSETYGGGFEWWPAGSPTATPTLIQLPYGDPVYDVYYMDVDSSGNLWFDYYGYDSTTDTYGYGLAEITTPTTDPTFNSIFPAGKYEFA
jgi:hypothetical protein